MEWYDFTVYGYFAAVIGASILPRGRPDFLAARRVRPLSRRAKRRSSAAPGSLRKKYAGIAHPPNMVRLHINSTTSGDQRKPVSDSGETWLTRGDPVDDTLADHDHRCMSAT